MFSVHKYLIFGYHLPYFFSRRLFGDRKQWGLTVNQEDPCWTEWTQRYLDFYYATQKESIGAVVNNSGYQVLDKIDFTDKKVLEIGPGDIHHLPYWWKKTDVESKRPPYYIIVDVQQEMLNRSTKVLTAAGIPNETLLISRTKSRLPFDDNKFDTVVTFYALEHIYPLGPYLDELKRLLKPGGLLVGAIPAEGGLAWGLGRFLTSRRWLKNNTTIDPDKIICWEHPNFSDLILKRLDERFERRSLQYWPLRVPLVDINLVLKFIYRKL